MQDNETFDFWYAINNTEVVIRPRQQLETFGSTTIYYHLVSETMDSTSQIRVREGRIHAYRPQIITPDSLSKTMLEGFGEEQVSDYINWLRQNEASLVLLNYGFSIRKESLNEHIITDSIDHVLEQVKLEVANSSQPMHALIRGVDEPWEVCLVQLMVDVVQQSAASNAQELRQDPQGHRFHIDRLFREASRNASLIPELSRQLKSRNLFKEYEDRFFALVKAAQR